MRASSSINSPSSWHHLSSTIYQMGRSLYFCPSSLYISAHLLMKSRIFSTAVAGESIFAPRPKVAIHAKKGGDNSTGRVAVKCFSSSGTSTTFLPKHRTERLKNNENTRRFYGNRGNDFGIPVCRCSRCWQRCYGCHGCRRDLERLWQTDPARFMEIMGQLNG